MSNWIRKCLFVACLFALVSANAAPTFGLEANSIWKFIDFSRPLVIAHRGASSLAPENTLSAVHKALELGVDVVEIDVHRTKDGELVVLHDDTVNRTTSGTGKVKNFTLEDLQKLDAGEWFGPAFRGEQIPTLRQVLEATRDQAVLLIELKGERTEVRTVELVQELGLDDQVILQSFDFQRIQKAKQKAPQIPTVFLVSTPYHDTDSEKAANWMGNVAEYVKASGIAIRHNWLTPELLELAEKRGLAIFVWTVDNAKTQRKYIELGVQGIITNKPQNLLDLLP